VQVSLRRLRPGLLVVEVEGRLDSYTVGDVGDRLIAIAGEPGLRLVLSLGRLDYVSSTGLAVILRCAQGLAGQGGALSIAGARGAVAAALEHAGFATIIPVFATEAEAVAGEQGG
jgi:anti-sigma B factor antagonist